LMRTPLVVLCVLLGAMPCAAQEPDPWFSTFSIIAVDPATGELGVGVQSRAFAAGAAVPFAKPGVGAVATQASANRSYGPKAIALLESGHYSDAIAEQQKAIAITPNNEQMHYALAQRFAQAGEAQNALASLAEAVRRQPYLKKQAANDPLFAKMKELAEFKRLVM